MPPSFTSVRSHWPPSRAEIGRGGRSFVFYHDGMADTLLRPDEVDRDLIAHATVFHFGSVTLAAEPSRDRPGWTELRVLPRRHGGHAAPARRGRPRSDRPCHRLSLRFGHTGRRAEPRSAGVDGASCSTTTAWRTRCSGPTRSTAI